MAGIRDTGDGTVVVEGTERTLVYTPRLVTLDDGTTVAHESRGGDMSSVWAVDLGGDFFAEVAHLGDGPVGGELVMTVTWIGREQTLRHVAIGEQDMVDERGDDDVDRFADVKTTLPSRERTFAQGFQMIIGILAAAASGIAFRAGEHVSQHRSPDR